MTNVTDDIKVFIEDRLRELEHRIKGAQVNISGLDITKTIEADIKACRALLGFASDVEASTVPAVTASQVEGILKTLASRWRDHPKFNKSWLHKL
jgi:hypothetical protein